MSKLTDSNGHLLAKQTNYFFTEDPLKTPTEQNAPLSKFQEQCISQVQEFDQNIHVECMISQARIDAGVAL